MEIITLATGGVYTVLLGVKMGMARSVKDAGAQVARRSQNFNGNFATKP
jgi:hypothetical protein